MLNLNLNSLSSNRGPAGPAPIPVPVVDFSASTTGPTAGDSVSFTDLSTNSPTAWQWEFPGGTPTGSTGQNPTITYSATGSYNVTLYAGNTGGTGSLTKTNFINVTAAPTPPVETLFTNSGTWSCTPGTLCVEIVAVGGGAGGRSTIGSVKANPGRQTGGGGGGAGEVVVCTLTSGFGSSQSIVIGNGGGSNTAGQSTCFGSLITALGGSIGGAPVYVASAGTSTTPGGDGGGDSSNGGCSQATAADFGGAAYPVQNQGQAGQSVTARPGGGGGGGGYSQCLFAYAGCGGAGGAGGTICGITLGTGGAGGTSCTSTPMPNAPGNAASGYGAGGGGAASPYDYCLGTTIPGGAGGKGVLKVIEYFS